MTEATKPKSSRLRAFNSPTIYDIAELAGVNPSTVSRALNRPGRINAATEAKIRAAAESLNYRVNPMARSLPTGRTNMLAVIVADITNPMFFDAVRGAEESASKSGYTTVIAESQESSRNEAVALEKILPSVDGVVLATTRLSDAEIASIAKNKPVVLMNRKVEGVSDVVPEILPGVEQALTHLKDLGHSHVAFVAGPQNAWMSTQRWNLILDTALTLGMKVIEIGPNEPTFPAGKEALRLVLASGVTAVIAYNDLVAIGIMKAAQDQGMSVPEDLSIIGFDDIFGSELTTPSLTTIKSPLLESGSIAVEKLIALLDGSEVEAETVPLRTELVARQSTAKRRSN
ncbi:MAG: LacI family DNA-binding transcriptional regulator [Actinomycetota bacterium]